MNFEREITVMVTCSYDELTSILEKQGFHIELSTRLIDSYYFKSDVDILGTPNDVLLTNYLLVREPDKNNAQITCKYKEFNEDNSIKRQGKHNCDVVDAQEAHILLETIGYKKGFVIDNIIKHYVNGKTRLVGAYVNDEYLCLEYSSETASLEELIEEFNEFGIPYDDSNYFVNKAMIELDKMKESTPTYH